MRQATINDVIASVAVDLTFIVGFSGFASWSSAGLGHWVSFWAFFTGACGLKLLKLAMQ